MLDKNEAKKLGSFLKEEAEEDTAFKDYVMSRIYWAYIWLILLTVLAVFK